MPSACNNTCKLGNKSSCAPRRRSRRSRRNQRGGDNSGALIQLAPVSKATAGLYSPNGGDVQQQMQAEVKDALANVFGPNKIQQFGGKRKGHKGRSRKTRRRTHRR
jgi:hypothetical protein